MTQAAASNAFPAPEHDHDRCLAEAMERARAAFSDKGLKLTPLRQSVFREIAASHKAIGAYDVLDRLAAKGERLAPISVYRAIDALVAAGIVHRFESRNAFFACHAGHDMRQLVLACETCGRVAEVDGDKVFAGHRRGRALGWVLDDGCRGRGQGPVRGVCGATAWRTPGARAWKAMNRAARRRHWPEPIGRLPAGSGTITATTITTIMRTTTVRPLAHDADALISARSLWLSRSGRTILQGVDIDIAAGEIVTLIGPNGAGKTTLVRVLLGLETPGQGHDRAQAGPRRRLRAAALRGRSRHPDHRRALRASSGGAPRTRRSSACSPTSAPAGSAIASCRISPAASCSGCCWRAR